MAKQLVETFTTTKKHTIFTGKNALRQALWFSKHNRLAHPDELYGWAPTLQLATSWGKPKSASPVSGTHVHGSDGVHAKMYITPSGHVVLASQNNGSSPLFEFAVLYHGGGSKLRDVREFVKSSIKRARSYAGWWRVNKSRWRDAA